MRCEWHVESIIEHDRRQKREGRMGTIELGLDQLPWGRVLFAGVLADGVEGRSTGGCFGQQVRAVMVELESVEFVFHDAVAAGMGDHLRMVVAEVTLVFALAEHGVDGIGHMATTGSRCGCMRGDYLLDSP
jgi:hypothetical protein